MTENDDTKLAGRFRDEDRIASGRHLILFDDAGNEEMVRPSSKIHFRGDCGLIRIHQSTYRRSDKIRVICGDRSYVEINRGVVNFLLSVECEAPGSTVVIGRNATVMTARIRVTAEPDLECIIGSGALISANVNFRPSDGHTIFDINNPLNVLNEPLRGIHVGNHVWIGADVTILKDVTIPDDCVIGRGSLVTCRPYETHSIIAGVPARTIRTGVSWSHKHIGDHRREYLARAAGKAEG